MPEYKRYIRCHIVEATPMTRGEYNELRGWEMPANENPADEGYHVVYPDGYESWCPKAQFEAAGRPIDGMTFGQAIEAMKQEKTFHMHSLKQCPGQRPYHDHFASLGVSDVSPRAGGARYSPSNLIGGNR